MKSKRVVVWFRRDLRLHDNEALTNALNHGEEIVPIYVFDTREFLGKTSFGFPKTEKFRAKFILECVQDLKSSFQRLGIDLVVKVGIPEVEVFKLCQICEANTVYCNIERTQEEIEVQDTLERNLWSVGKEIAYTRGKMLYYTQDLPFPVAHTPDVFTHFRKEVEKYVPIRKPLPKPENLTPWSIKVEINDMPTVNDLGHTDFGQDKRGVMAFEGGETAGLAHLKHYLWEKELVKTYKKTKNGLIGADYSSKLSPWLAQGCISPKYVYYELKRYEKRKMKNKVSYPIFFELLWRDFFRLMGKKHKNKIFLKSGTKGEVGSKGKEDMKLFYTWADGQTGIPFIDANMRELNLTGWMSSRGRQNVASFLVNELGINWQIGAEYFESLLIDYDVTSNYGNWNYIAGVGSDAKENRHYNILLQGKRYDSKGKFIKLWLNELTNVPVKKIHQPDLMTMEEQTHSKVRLGKNYPMPVVNTARW